MVDPTPPQPAPNMGFDPSAAATRATAPKAAGNGVNWWSEGWRYFAAAPWMWIGLALSFIVILALASAVPIIGSIASTVLSPVLAAAEELSRAASSAIGIPRIVAIMKATSPVTSSNRPSTTT